MAGQRLMQAASDIFLGWERVTRGGATIDYYVRQLRDWKASRRLEDMDREAWTFYGASCAAGPSPAPTPVQATASRSAAYLGKSTAFARALPSSPGRTPTRTSAITSALASAVAAGRVEAQVGV